MTEPMLPPVRVTGQWAGPTGTWCYDSWGRHGRPVVLIPALLFDRRVWWPVAADLRTDATVIAVDLPGHGGSAGRRRYQADALLDELAALLASLETRQAPIVVGHGWAAGLALRFAARYATHAVVTVDADHTVPVNRGEYLRGLDLDAVPRRYRHLLRPARSPGLLRDYAGCLRACPPTPPAAGSLLLAVHSAAGRGALPRGGGAVRDVEPERGAPTGRPTRWRRETYDVAGRFAQLADVERFASDIRTLLQPRDPSVARRHEGER